MFLIGTNETEIVSIGSYTVLQDHIQFGYIVNSDSCVSCFH